MMRIIEKVKKEAREEDGREEKRHGSEKEERQGGIKGKDNEEKRNKEDKSYRLTYGNIPLYRAKIRVSSTLCYIINVMSDFPLDGPPP